MTDTYAILTANTVTAIRKAASDLRAKHTDLLHGFALCTDDNVMTLYCVSCTKSWVSERKEKCEAIGYIDVDWEDDTGTNYFDNISNALAKLADNDSEAACDGRFESLVEALQQCRDEKLFDEETLLSCGSTDPSDHLEMLQMRAVDRLNKPSVADEFAKHLGCEHHRESGG